MDVNACLKEIRELVDKSDEDGGLLPHKVDRLTELFRSLDEWISKGGFLPADWNKGRDSK